MQPEYDECKTELTTSVILRPQVDENMFNKIQGNSFQIKKDQKVNCILIFIS